MNDKKNIERFFQEKFKDFEVNPEPQAWENISKKLNKKKNKKRIFPFWFKLGGIAAGLIIGYFVLNNNLEINKREIINDTTIVNSDKIDANIKKNDILKPKDSINKSIVLKDKINTKPLIKNNNDKEVQNFMNLNNKNIPNLDKNIVAINKNSSDKNSNNLIEKVEKNKHLVTTFKNKLNKISNDLDNTVAENEKNYVNEKSNSKSNLNNQVNDNEKIVFENKDSNNKHENNSNKQNESISNTNSETITLNSNKNYSEVSLKDSIKKIDVLENPLEKILKEKENKKSKKAVASNSEKWKIRPNIAPIFMNANGGSPIHDVFADNEKEFENKLSVGIGADYAISKRFSIRAGINKFDLAYNTNEIAYYLDPTAGSGVSLNNPIETINLRGEFQNIVIGDRKSKVSSNVISGQPIEEVGALNQKFGYIEIPVELSYKILDNKFGITLISGLSTLLLSNNEISIVSDNKTLDLGNVNNLNKIHYSTNFGIGFKYNILKSLEINVEPTVKYQINTFNDNSGGFNPYIIGVYSGISYKL